MSSDNARAYEPDYRQNHVDKTLEEFDTRISRNEKRWLMTKGALGMLAAIKGVDFAIGQLGSLI